MGALPKRKISKQRKNNRRSHHAIDAVSLNVCNICKKEKPIHQVCPNCGNYKGTQFINLD